MISIHPWHNGTTQKKSLPSKACAALAAAATLYATYGISNYAVDFFNSNAIICKLNDIDKTKKAYKDAFNQTKLKEKGVQTFFVPLAKGDNDMDRFQDIKNIISDIDSYPEEEKILNAIYPEKKNTLYTKLCDRCEEILRKNPNSKLCKKIADYLFGAEDVDDALWQLDEYISIKYADNALFSTSSNAIIVPDTELNTPFFHEMGHAINYNLKKTGKLISNLSNIKYDAAIALSIAAILLPSQADKENKNKPIDFLQKNIGKLAFITTIPLLLEEFRASYNGLKAAKPFLDTNDYKTFKRSYLNGFMGYLSSSVCVALGAYLAVKLKNYIVGKMSKKSQKAFFAEEKSGTDSTQCRNQDNIGKSVGTICKRQGDIHSPKAAKHSGDR